MGHLLWRGIRFHHLARQNFLHCFAVLHGMEMAPLPGVGNE